MEKLKNLKGKEFNHLILIRESKAKNGRRRWWVRCLYDGPKCKGITEFEAEQSPIVEGRTKSCGCLHREIAIKRCSVKQQKHPAWNGTGEISHTYWQHLRKGALSRNIEFNISVNYGWKLFEKQNRRCALSNIPLIFSSKSAGTASIDRIDNTKGYVEGNIQWVHKDINRMKWAHSFEKFLMYCKAVVNTFQPRKNDVT
jgi:hypothetical protein